MILEIAVFNIESAILAAEAGADRLELCENPLEGGTTPSYGTLQKIQNEVSIPVFPIIRPRGGDFLYTETSFETMCTDVNLCKNLGFPGVVLGLLNADGKVDAKRTGHLIELAYPMEVSFHRAFDRTIDPFEAMETIIELGCSRILTSGQVPNVMNGMALIKSLITQANNRIIIMPGSGLRSTNAKALVDATGASEIHSSARIEEATNMEYINSAMQENLTLTSVSVEEIKQLKKLFN